MFVRNHFCTILFLSVWLCLSGSPVVARAQTDNERSGDQLLYGVIETPLAHLRTVVKRNTETGEPPGWLISPDQTDREFPLDELEWSEDRIVFRSQALDCEFEGQVKQGHYQGMFKQRGGEFPLTLTAVRSMPPTQPREIWSGTLKALFRKLDLQVRVFDAPDGTAYVVFDSLNEGVKGLYATMELAEGKLSFQIPASKASFEGKWDAATETADGHWKQSGLQFAMQWKRTSEVPKAARPQTPKPPFSYHIEEVKFSSRSSGVELAGTLTVPKFATKTRSVPAVVMISGSGPQDRDETLLEHRPFAVWADFLTRHGVAVLRFDDRGVGQSSGAFGEATTADFAKDVGGAIDFLASRPELDRDRLGLIGHSEGGLIAPMVANRSPELVDFIVMLAGPGVRGDQIVQSQTQLILAANGADAETLKQAGLVARVLHETLNRLGEPSVATLTETLTQELAKQVPESQWSLFFDEPAGEATELQLKDSIRQGLTVVTTPWFRYFLKYDPVPALERLQCPVLAMVGEKDLQVAPDLNLPPIRRALKNSDSLVVEVTGVNHLFQECETGSITEYYSISQTVSPKVLQQVADWIGQVAGPLATE